MDYKYEYMMHYYKEHSKICTVAVVFSFIVKFSVATFSSCQKEINP